MILYKSIYAQIQINGSVVYRKSNETLFSVDVIKKISQKDKFTNSKRILIR